MTNNNFSEEVKDRTKRAMFYATRAYELLTGSEQSETLPLATGYISCAFSYIAHARSILLVHPEANNDWIVSAFLELFEDFADIALAYIDGSYTLDNLASAYYEIEKLQKEFEKN